jgi:phosphoglucosamine mutase
VASGKATRSLFGTDGVRGVANRDLTPELAMAIGRGLGARLSPGATVLVGRDTRRSGPMLEAALAAGLASAGVHVELGGVLPTPAVAELVARGDFAAGVVVSASHNPFPDNGIKLFGPDGFKLPDLEEAAIEQAMDEAGPRPEAEGLGSIDDWPEGRRRYVQALLERFPIDLSSIRVVVDCAHGATVVSATDVLHGLGAQIVEVIGAEPDGVNINVACGSTHLAAVAEAVVRTGADVGLAFDGDGDRLLAIDQAGNHVDGDQILAILALRLKARDELDGGAVVTTTMTNLGFRSAMRANGIEVRWTDVGDRYVLEEMRSGGFVIGGEQSGHLINLRSGPTGDGLAAGLQLLHAVVEAGRPLSELASVVQRMPQKLVSFPVADKEGLAEAVDVWSAVADCERELGDDGRVVVRASGTEQLVRVMVEAPTDEACDRWCATIAAIARRALGGMSATSGEKG